MTLIKIITLILTLSIPGMVFGRTCLQLFENTGYDSGRPGIESQFSINNVLNYELINGYEKKNIQTANFELSKESVLKKGHFPGLEVLPGVHIQRLLLKTAQNLLPKNLQKDNKLVLSFISDFVLPLKPLRNGTFILRITLLKTVDNFYYFKGEIKLSNGNKIAESYFTANSVNKNEDTTTRGQGYGKLNQLNPITPFHGLNHGSLNRKEIRDFLPHKAPILMLQKVLHRPINYLKNIRDLYFRNLPIEDLINESLTAIVDTNFNTRLMDNSQSHNPVLLRELQFEAMFQSGSLFLYDSYRRYKNKRIKDGKEAQDLKVFLLSIDSAQVFYDVPFGSQILVRTVIRNIEFVNSEPIFTFDSQIKSLDDRVKYSEITYKGKISPTFLFGMP